MTILSRIRSRVGLLVGIIFLALLAFVLTDLFNSQHGFFAGSSKDDIGEISGHTITYTEFMNRMKEVSKGKNLSETEQSSLAEGIWQEMLDKYIYQPQYDALGIQVGVDELSSQMYSDHPSPYMNQFFQDRQSGQIYEQFRGPDGQLSGQAIRDYVNKMPADGEEQWALVETDMLKFLIREKYNNLLRKGFYVTSSETRHQYADANTKYNFKYIVKKFADVNDSTIKVSNDEMLAYYNANPWKFKQSEENRSMDFLAYDLYPSADDIAKERADMDTLAIRFKAAKRGEEDSLMVLAQDENGAYNLKSLHPGQFPVGSDSAFIKAAPGDVLGPFNEGENITIYKKISDTTGIDSVKIRHLLVAYKGAERAGPDITRTKDKAKLRADSILRVVKGGKKLEDLVETLTDDPGSKQGNKGDYGWFTYESGFVKEFKDAGFNNPKGAVIVVETSFGYHVIEVLDKSASSTKVKVLPISKKLVPSSTTVDGIFNTASIFASTNNTGELFTKAVQKDNKQLLKADKITEAAKSIQGITNVKDIVRWMYDENTVVGTVSEPKRDGDRYIICHLTNILLKGTKPFDDPDVKSICEVEAKKIKKAQMFSDELLKDKANSIDQWAANAKLSVMSSAGLALAQPYIQGAGLEGVVAGTLASMKAGQLSSVIKGTNGVYVVMLESITTPEPLKDLEAERNKTLVSAGGRADAQASEILNDAAEITDNRAKHF
ncbi:MAG TPA: peptidylprolyl isomerase [Bacteroidia bacterium]|jgi:peptidyl-prolyl cis-trans isomerase D|nr:peptidylprolyl isomerase [Bacteroidia bacterium]